MKTTKEMLEVMQAFADGKKVEMQADACSAWATLDYDCGTRLGWNWHLNDYRIKPEPKYRPWKAEEVPMGKVIRAKTNSYTRLMICGVVREQNMGIKRTLLGFGCPLFSSISADEALKAFVMEDGSPCGVKEE